MVQCLGSQRFQGAATPQKNRAVDASGLSTGVVTDNMGFIRTSEARETRAVSGIRVHGLSLPLNHIHIC